MPKSAVAKPRLSKQERDARVVADLLDDMDRTDLPPWQMPWVKNMLRQRNAISGRLYRGINMFLTARKGEHANYADHRWLTYRQAQAAGGRIRKGEHGVRIVFWKFPDRTEETSEAAPPWTRAATAARRPTKSGTTASSCGSTPFSTPARPKT